MSDANEHNSLLMVSYGEYDDYRNPLFRVLKPFTFAAALNEFATQHWVSKSAHQRLPTHEEFLDWLRAQGYLSEAEVPSVFLGFGTTPVIEEAAASTEFAP